MHCQSFHHFQKHIFLQVPSLNDVTFCAFASLVNFDSQSLTQRDQAFFWLRQDTFCLTRTFKTEGFNMNNGDISPDRRKKIDLVTEIVKNSEGAAEFVHEILQFSKFVSLQRIIWAKLCLSMIILFPSVCPKRASKLLSSSMASVAMHKIVTASKKIPFRFCLLNICPVW